MNSKIGFLAFYLIMQPGAVDSLHAQTIFRGATIVDVERGALIPNRDIVVQGDRITGIGTFNMPGATVIDARGKYVIPGLWDMHAHIGGNFEQHAPLLLAHGITGIRNPHVWNDTMRAVRARIAASSTPMPRFIASGQILDGDPPVRPNFIVVKTPQDAAAAVDSSIRAGADFLKLYNRLTPATYFAIAAEAKRRGIPFTGHLPQAVGALEASNAGQVSIEHIVQLALECSSRAAELNKSILAAPPGPQRIAARHAAARLIAETYDPAKCQQIGQHFARNGTYVTPTLALARAFTYSNDTTWVQAQRLRVSPPGSRELWLKEAETGPPELRGEGRQPELNYRTMSRAVADLHRGGAIILAGSDVPSPFMAVGFSLHDELVALVEDAGLAPIDALRSATLNPSKYFGKTETTGTIALGKAADFVILDANPLDNIRNTSRIWGVVIGGQYLDRTTLHRFLNP